LDDLGTALAARGDALALIGLGSVGLDLERLDEHSDMDFFVVVDDGAKQRYLDSLEWLEEVAAIEFSFPNSVDGRKVLFEDGLFAEYAIFTVEELRAGSFPPGRLVWARAGAPAGIERCGRPREASPYDYPEYHINEAVTNLYVGLHRDARGERLTATRFIQSYAVERLLTYLDLTGASGVRQDEFVIERGVERRFGPDALPLARMVPGYERNKEAALAILEWIEEREEVPAVLADEIRRLALTR
jgi:hypothetical protein